ncbi:ribosomal RNA small subunit methyltransferase A [Patescibacteria group bacterium]|nr:ribosomal RNA small subunit methyltransferase A [Candidatus Falkowbacteria bacterium]MBU3906297.1 ribosomal RNA small subunit methyltransferase A [Patescibacteria group bacterium]MBU4015330.1 ribosomal RNA small subunit methyltransferase A [Patescibacteria group bacterium]MBU4026902.1 ribosomal RNA small subunit methyltransferase A [Patescibacteria group bacterium]MBU4072925.1 ribosomal RNA small subunit methyltransferase A [Patescibacteria group bacterium]
MLQQTKQLCKLYNIKPARSKGQNFLINEDVYDKLIEAADLTKDDTVLEVGPGLGFLTAKLAQKAKKVIAVELDDKLAEILRIGLKAKGITNVEVVNENILTSPLTPLLIRRGELKGRGYKIVANLPYNITSIFLRQILSAEVKPSLMVLMLQKEVAERITAKPGKMNLLAVSVQFYANSEIMRIVPADNFWPEPKVDSAIIRLTPKPPLLAKEMGSEKEFFRLMKIGFSAKRKMLKNNLAGGYHISHEDAGSKLKKAGLDIKIRAQNLSLEDWKKLFGNFT